MFTMCILQYLQSYCTLDANCLSHSAIHLWSLSGGGLALPDFASVAVFDRMIALYSPVAN